jgi:acyl-CoA synthetase (NDP forming)
VLSADEWEEEGFNVVPLPDGIRNELKHRAPDIWDWIGNPADRSMMEGSQISTGNILKMMSKETDFDFLVANVTDDAPFERERWTATLREEISDFIEIGKNRKKPLAVVLRTGDLAINHFDDWRWKFIAEQRRRLIDAQIPFFSSFGRAAKAMRCLVEYYQKIL